MSDLDRPDLAAAARVYALLVEFFGSNLRGDQQTLHQRLASIVIEANLRAEKAEAEVERLEAELVAANVERLWLGAAMTQPKRSLEEIAEDCLDQLQRGNYQVGEPYPHRTTWGIAVRAALREAADAARQEHGWRCAAAAIQARQEEREALRELASRLDEVMLSKYRLFAWLDARSRGEETKP